MARIQHLTASNQLPSSPEGSHALPCTAKGLRGRRLGSSYSIFCCDHSQCRTRRLLETSTLESCSLLSYARDSRVAGEQGFSVRVMGRRKTRPAIKRDDSLTIGTRERLKFTVTRAAMPSGLDINWEDTLGVKPEFTCLDLSS